MGEDSNLISTHTPLAGRDMTENDKKKEFLRFLLTRPLRDVTHHLLHRLCNIIISTHTPLAGRDQLIFLYFPTTDDFYSHAPCGT